MKIQSCYIENFGKLHHFSISLDPHLTVLAEENGWGKSTLAAFIKAMFYGMDYKPRAKLGDNERKKYQPWQMGTYGGSLVFEQGGRIYRIERSFGAKASEDHFTLYDEQTGMVSEEYSSNIGEELFAVDQVSYGYTTYLAQNRHEVAGTDQIFALLTGGCAQSGEKDMDSYSEAVKRLKEEARQYKKTGGRGSIDLTINRITQAEQELRTTRAQVESYEEWSRKLNRCLEEAEDRKRKLAEDKKLVEKAGIAEGSRARIAQMDSLEKREIRLSRQLAEIQEHFPRLEEDGIGAYEEDLNQQLVKAQQLSRDRKEMLSRQTQLDTLSMMPVVLEMPEEETQEQPEGSAGTVWLVLTAVSTIAVLVAGILVTPAALAGLLLPVIFGSLFLWKRKQGKERIRKQQQQRKADWQQQKEAAKNSRQQKLDAYRESLTQLQNQCDDREQQLQKALDGYHMKETANYEIAVAMLQEMLKNSEDLNRELQEIRTEKAELLKFGTVEQLRETADEGLSMESAQIQQKQDEDALYKILDEEKAYRSQMLRLEGADQQATDLVEELEMLRTKLAEEEARYDAIETAIQLLEEARERFSKRYAEPVKKNFDHYAAALGFSEEEQPCVDARLCVGMKAAGMQRETEYFSKGTRDLLWFCLRIAVVESVFQQEKPFLILDDPFAELDEKHNEKAQSAIRKLSEDYQILYMTCHESRVPKERT
ncbi:MAG: ATP-binding protein [Lachnospiraceae bacterium]